MSCSEYEFDALVYLGRFQLPHKGHGSVFEAARPRCRRLYNLVGWAGMKRTRKNPFSFQERLKMNRASFGNPSDPAWLHIHPLVDQPTDEQWVEHVRGLVAGLNYMEYYRQTPKVGLIGHEKDASSYYLHLFPEWELIDIGNFEGISSTPIRNDYFADAEAALVKHADYLPNPVVEFLRDFAQTDNYTRLRNEPN